MNNYIILKISAAMACTRSYFILCTLLICSSCYGFDAQLYDEENQCWEAYQEIENEFLGPSSCDASLTFAVDEEDRLWQFATTCIPEGYTKHQPDPEISASPECE